MRGTERGTFSRCGTSVFPSHHEENFFTGRFLLNLSPSPSQPPNQFATCRATFIQSGQPGCDLLNLFVAFMRRTRIRLYNRQFLSGKNLMFSRHMLWVAAITAAFVATPSASAQYYNSGGCSSCAPPAPTITSCAPIQPVYSSCYQTVPVTTYQQEKQTVKVPVYKTSYETREVTVHEPVTRQKTVSVPTVAYKTVYENRTINKDNGRWQTNYHPVAKCDPCQVDSRPGMIGWLNRTGYSFRSAFVPNYRTTRQYVPNMMTCNVQVPRQVAVHGTKQVVQNYTEFVAKKVAQRVEVRKLAYEEKEITVSRPVTAYRTVPIGTSMAYGYGGYGYPGSQIVRVIDEEDTSRTARRPEPDSAFGDLKSADETFKEDGLAPRSGDKSFNRKEVDSRFQRSSHSHELPSINPGLEQPRRVFPSEDTSKPDFSTFESSQRESRYDDRQAAYSHDRTPTVTRGWTASRRSSENTASTDRLTIPNVSLTDRN
jgi:hypothetical protein